MCHSVSFSLELGAHWDKQKLTNSSVEKKKEKIEKLALRIIVLLIKSVFYVNNLNPSITNTKYVIFVPTHCGYFTNSPVYLTAFPSPSTTSDYQFLFANNNFLYWQTFFSCCFFLCFYWLFFFGFNLVFSYSGIIWFLLTLVIFSWLCCNFPLKSELIMTSDFLSCRFVR